MCGILFAQSNNQKTQQMFERNVDAALRTIALRGPDRNDKHIGENYIIGHAHLIITGNRPQPVQCGDFCFTFNGEIYNEYEEISERGLSDADILERYLREYSIDAFSKLDGEFAAIVYYPATKKLIISTDIFGTKPLYMMLGTDFVAVGTYESTVKAFGIDLGVVRIPSNTTFELDLNTYRIISSRPLYRFDFSDQTIDSYEPWIDAFTEAVRKRTFNKQQKYFISFSSGHDSGVIAAEMDYLGVPFKAYTCEFMENLDVLHQRLSILKAKGHEVEIIKMTNEIVDRQKRVMKKMEPYLIFNDEDSTGPFPNPQMAQVPGYVASSYIHEKARQDGRYISLSGQGADEIISDYYNQYSRSVKSELKGDWEGIRRPWRNLVGGWNRVFLGAIERIAGLHGIETRYPFLDRGVVQTFISMTPKLKMKEYKGPIAKRLRQFGFPYHDRKQGFGGYKRGGV